MAARLLMPLVALGLCSCGPPTGSVSGKITSGGKEVSAGQVSFTGKSGVPVVANIEPDSSYRLSNLEYGEYLVVVTVASAEQKGVEDDFHAARARFARSKEKDKKPPAPAPVKSTVSKASVYAGPKSPLRCTIAQPEQRCDFALE